MIEKPKRPKQPSIQERQPPRTLQELINRYDLDNTKVYDFLDELVSTLNDNYNYENVIIGTGAIDGNLNPINITDIDFSLYRAIAIQIGSPREGDSKTILIDNNSDFLNDIVHLDMYATNSYYCKGFAYVAKTNGTFGYLSVIPRELVGWSYVSVKVTGLKKI